MDSPYWHVPTIKNMTDGNVTFQMYHFDENKDYWVIEVYNGNSFECYPIETLVPEEILRKLWNKEIFLLVSNTHETYHSVITGIYRDLIVRAKIPIEQIILLSESADIIKEVDIVRKKYNLGQINVEWIRSFEYTVKNQLMNLDIPLTLENKHYDKKFLKLHFESRLHLF